MAGALGVSRAKLRQCGPGPGADRPRFPRGGGQRCAHARHRWPATAGQAAGTGSRPAGDPGHRPRRCADGGAGAAPGRLRLHRETLHPRAPARQRAPRPGQAPAGLREPPAASAVRPQGPHRGAAARRLAADGKPAPADPRTGRHFGEYPDSRRHRQRQGAGRPLPA
ncbi:hypothetical protein D3C86_1712380 [compost metagenome]